MKTTNLSKKSLLMTMIMAATALFSSHKERPALANAGGGSVWDPSGIYIPQRKKFKGYQREQKIGRRRSKFYFNKNR